MNQNIHYFYFGRPEAAGARNRWATVAYTLQSSAIGLALSYAVAFCNPKDNFCKARGRLIASNRLKSLSQTTRFHIKGAALPTTNAEYRELETQIFSDAVDNHLPAAMREAIQILEAA